MNKLYRVVIRNRFNGGKLLKVVASDFSSCFIRVKEYIRDELEVDSAWEILSLHAEAEQVDAILI